MKFQFKGLLQDTGWVKNAVVETDESGIIVSLVETEQTDEFIDGYAIPGFQNAHSHSFQYAMAGLAENHSSGDSKDDFWSWREAMYRLALSVDPDQFETIAMMLYAELLRHGYTNVAEFHYLHQDKDGRSYENVAEMGSRLVNAAKNTGIGITLIPIFYKNGGFDRPPNSNQRRFISTSIEDYEKLYQASESACKDYGNANVGVGIHSMRAVDTESILDVARSFPQDVPFHIHISEQLREVEDCKKFLGRRPVQWLLENIDLSDRFNLVHATHMVDEEIRALAGSGANVVLCPTTEGNLGDGIFPLREFQDSGGNWSIGTDSHVSLSPFEELRLLDYGQRLTSHKRNTFSDRSNCDGAQYALGKVTVVGRKAMNDLNPEYFVVGERFNACVISSDHPLIRTASDQNRLSTIVYSSDETMQLGTIAGGKWCSMDGRHFDQENIYQNFCNTIRSLGIR